MPVKEDSVVVLGAGSWGTALALLLSYEGGPPVRLWDRNAAQIAALIAHRENARYLPGFPLPPTLSPTANIAEAIQAAGCVIVAVPSGAVEGVLRLAAPHLPATGCDIVLAAKGMEAATGRLPDQIAEAVLGPAFPLIALSGPNLAAEVVRGVPAAAVAACPSREAANRVAAHFNAREKTGFRVYTSHDRIGVEIGGAVKNVLAIAGGVSDGLQFGDNTKATLLTRGLVEMTRLGVACGAAAETFYGLAGVGDLMATATSRLSRNWRVGEGLARSEPLEIILERLGQVAEGVTTAQAVRILSRRLDIQMPVCDAVYAILFEGVRPTEAVAALMARTPGEEWNAVVR